MVSQKEKIGFKKGDYVYKITTWGNNKGMPNTQNRYKIRSIGSKRAIVDQVDEFGNYFMVGETKIRGESIFLSTKNQYESAKVRGMGVYYPYLWKQVFVHVDKAEWDLDINFDQ